MQALYHLTMHIPYFPVIKHPIFAYDAGQENHNVGQNLGKGCLFSGLDNNSKIR